MLLGCAGRVAASSSSGSRSYCSCARVRLPRRILAGAAFIVLPTCSCSSAGLPTLRSQVPARLISSTTPLHHESHGACFKIHMLGGTAWSRPMGFSQQHLPQSPPHVPLRATSHPSPPPRRQVCSWYGSASARRGTTRTTKPSNVSDETQGGIDVKKPWNRRAMRASHAKQRSESGTEKAGFDR